MSSEVYKTDRVPGIWTGRRRMEKPKRLEPLPPVFHIAPVAGYLVMRTAPVGKR